LTYQSQGNPFPPALKCLFLTLKFILPLKHKFIGEALQEFIILYLLLIL